MKNPLGYLCLIVLAASVSITQTQDLPPAQSIFMQGNNINAVFRTDGISNYDKVSFTYYEPGFIWPASASSRLTAVYTSGIWIGAKAGPQRELRLAASFYNTHYSPGNIPVLGQVPPSSVCSDPSWRGYYVQLTDPSLTNGGTRTKFAGGRPYTFNYDSWANWPVAKGAPYVEVNNIPGYQPSFNGDRPGIGNGMKARPEEILFMVYMDYTNCTNYIHLIESGLPGGTLPLGVEIQQLVFNFNCVPLRDMYFMKFRIINKNSLNWDSTYLGIVNEPDVGYDSDDALGCDTSREMGFCYNFKSSDPQYGINPPTVGYRFLQSPLKYTGNNNDTAKLPYDTLAGFLQPGMFAFNQFGWWQSPCLSQPELAYRAYNFMIGLNGCGERYINPISGLPTRFRFDGNSCTRTGWFDTTGIDPHESDKSGFMSSGPFTMNSGDTQIVVLSYMITRDGGNNFQNICALQSISDSALYHYYHDFQNCTPIGIQPVSSEIPQKFELFQNYPNPFNPITKLKFQIPKSEFVKLTLFEVTGREIEILVNEELKPGTYEINLDASNYPSGVYFYSIITGSYTQTKKMVLIK